MVTFHLYPKVPRKAIDFSKVKEQTLPSQSLSLREIIRRFVRHESLPVHKEGFYEDRMGDLEKLSNADITVQMERAEELKRNIAAADARMKKKEDIERQQAQTAIEASGVRNGPAGDGAAAADSTAKPSST